MTGTAVRNGDSHSKETPHRRGLFSDGKARASCRNEIGSLTSLRFLVKWALKCDNAEQLGLKIR
jgi:hypothetical protein